MFCVEPLKPAFDVKFECRDCGHKFTGSSGLLSVLTEKCPQCGGNVKPAGIHVDHSGGKRYPAVIVH